MYDLLIIGGGPAGLTASIYASRAGLNYALIDNMSSQVINTETINNYPGLYNISGVDLIMQMSEHAENLGMNLIMEDVIKIDTKDLKVYTDENIYETKNILICTGASHRHLNVPGEELFQNNGISYCATCDGAFFNNKNVVVVGGGDTALTNALYLSSICEHVTVIHILDKFQASDYLQKKLYEKENVEIIYEAQVQEIKGEDTVKSVIIETKDTKKEIKTDGVFVSIGIIPNSELVKDQVKLDKGYIVTDDHMRTSVKGIYAAGDVRNTPLRQILVACSDAAIAIETLLKD